MATNRTRVRGRLLSLAVTDGGVASGDPCLVGQMAGVAQMAKNGSNVTTVDTEGVYALSVKGVDGSGNSAVAVGDVIYYVTADTPKLSKKTSGVRFGIAVGTVTGGGTSTINVKVGA